ncbi:MAG: VOC family protein, partial [Gammaproteobacteria bacterium]|nr:VOC family protein [Gammaproteobacteria bacterium]
MITGMPRIAIAVHDFSATVSTFRDKFGMPVIDLSESSVDNLGAKLAMCVPKGGSNIELMSPADPGAPLSQSLQRFLDRRGEGLFALMLEAPDPNAEAKDLTRRGLNVIPLMDGAGGRDIHPNSTHGVLIRVYPVNSFQARDPGVEGDPPGLSGIARVIIAVQDLDHAMDVYGKKLAMGVAATTIDDGRGVRSAICIPAYGGVIELVSVEDSNRPFAKSVSAFLAADREGMYALVLQSRDPREAKKSLTARGLKVTSATDSPDILQVELEFGVRIR